MRMVYKGKFSTIIEETAKTKNGGKYKYAVTIGNRIAAVLPVFSDGSILLERQYRHAIRRWIYEIPAGHVEHGEGLEHAARRELEEETGYTAAKLGKLYKAFENPAGKRNPMHVFLATGLRKGRKCLEESERIAIRRVSLQEALAMIKANKIMDMKSISAILFYSCLVNNTEKSNRVRAES